MQGVDPDRLSTNPRPDNPPPCRRCGARTFWIEELRVWRCTFNPFDDIPARPLDDQIDVARLPGLCPGCGVDVGGDLALYQVQTVDGELVQGHEFCVKVLACFRALMAAPVVPASEKPRSKTTHTHTPPLTAVPMVVRYNHCTHPPDASVTVEDFGETWAFCNVCGEKLWSRLPGARQ